MEYSSISTKPIVISNSTEDYFSDGASRNFNPNKLQEILANNSNKLLTSNNIKNA